MSAQKSSVGIAKLRFENAEPNYGLQIPPEYDRKMSNVGRDVDYVPPPPAQPCHFASVLSCSVVDFRNKFKSPPIMGRNRPFNSSSQYDS